MARILNTEARPGNLHEHWTVPGPEVVIIALDKNEALAVRHGVKQYRDATTDRTYATSINGGGARVYEALKSLELGY